MKNLLLALLLFLTACFNKKSPNEVNENQVINLLNSVKVIRNVISQNKLSDLLEQHDPEQLESLMNNFSPAQMALESEVLSATIPLVVVYYYKPVEKENVFIKNLEILAKENVNKVKFVVIDADKLFSLAQDAEVNDLPAVVFTKNREIVDRINKDITINLIKNKIETLKD